MLMIHDTATALRRSFVRPRLLPPLPRTAAYFDYRFGYVHPLGTYSQASSRHPPICGPIQSHQFHHRTEYGGWQNVQPGELDPRPVCLAKARPALHSPDVKHHDGFVMFDRPNTLQDHHTPYKKDIVACWPRPAGGGMPSASLLAADMDHPASATPQSRRNVNWQGRTVARRMVSLLDYMEAQ